VIVSDLISLLNAGARVALVIVALVGGADLATWVVFTPSMIQARVDVALRDAPSLALLPPPQQIVRVVDQTTPNPSGDPR